MAAEPGGIALRPARAGDVAALGRLNAALQAFERTLRPTRRAPEDLPPGYVAELLARPDGGVIVAEAGAVLVGFIAYRFGADPLEAVPRECVITDLVIDEGHRGGGIGGSLIDAVEAIARAGGAARLCIAALVVNHGALAAYAARGFAPLLVMHEKALSPGATGEAGGSAS